MHPRLLLHKKVIFPPEGGAGEARGCAGVGVRVVPVKVTVLQHLVKSILSEGSSNINGEGHLEEDEVVGVHHLLAENHRQELVEGDVLDQGGVDVPGLLFA